MVQGKSREGVLVDGAALFFFPQKIIFKVLWLSTEVWTVERLNHAATQARNNILTYVLKKPKQGRHEPRFDPGPLSCGCVFS